jgi:hypothetical protein
METIETLGEDWQSHAFNVGVLYHNYGHAVYLQGVINSDLGEVERGIMALGKSFEIHKILKRMEACKQTADILKQAFEARKSLGGGEPQ